MLEAFRTIHAHAVEVPAAARQLRVSGQLGVVPDGVMRPDFAGQLGAAMDNVEAVLAAAGMARGMGHAKVVLGRPPRRQE